MITTSTQLKAKVRNLSNGDSTIAQTLIRNYFMERFLERIALSEYSNNFILKGGMLVASIVGIDLRATMDIDTTVEALPLNKDDAKRIIEEIISTDIEDGVHFTITKISDIMTDFEYPGIRMMLEATLDRAKQRIKIDISTDDVITPTAIQYSYKLMFEDRYIKVMSYTTETLLAEKIQTIIARGLANTRMRDFYDVYEICQNENIDVNDEILKRAFLATCKKRETIFEKEYIVDVMNTVAQDDGLENLWKRYKEENYYVKDLDWKDVSTVVKAFIINKIV